VTGKEIFSRRMFWVVVFGAVRGVLTVGECSTAIGGATERTATTDGTKTPSISSDVY